MRRLSSLLFAGLFLAASSQAFSANLRDILSSGATTASTYLTFKDNKMVIPAQDDASSYIASNGEIRGPYLEAALQKIRADHPDLQASDLELATAILTAQQ
ncbi:ribonucleotide reductase [Pseudomonas daroniae]|uniref:Ribonucleotide reductase n=1 Tax=Phytopseudomonas daroniae TaxID=2487519 RepID=A0A4Q9QG87_9GAMM|nr:MULTISPECIES: DUF2388 domain-containing protein [Pseudomonas]TBU72366.1 ribonucleotide reductase [Pseudomonas daroniae]TBU76262.1 ribonucleotide reductase [Pseudomonas daroniae]TBU76676.1 ribonucleotide reductase [Pseudomonas sp. FRB 228]TBU87378.1 ribonucleotide reductase [Pseudomonas daroniae]UCJ18175.1 DUF2388 domain-containing protein [Pseudomonas sp. MM211]